MSVKRCVKSLTRKLGKSGSLINTVPVILTFPLLHVTNNLLSCDEGYVRITIIIVIAAAAVMALPSDKFNSQDCPARGRLSCKSAAKKNNHSKRERERNT